MKCVVVIVVLMSVIGLKSYATGIKALDQHVGVNDLPLVKLPVQKRASLDECLDSNPKNWEQNAEKIRQGSIGPQYLAVAFSDNAVTAPGEIPVAGDTFYAQSFAEADITASKSLALNNYELKVAALKATYADLRDCASAKLEKLVTGSGINTSIGFMATGSCRSTVLKAREFTDEELRAAVEKAIPQYYKRKYGIDLATKLKSQAVYKEHVSDSAYGSFAYWRTTIKGYDGSNCKYKGCMIGVNNGLPLHYFLLTKGSLQIERKKESYCRTMHINKVTPLTLLANANNLLVEGKTLKDYCVIGDTVEIIADQGESKIDAIERAKSYEEFVEKSPSPGSPLLAFVESRVNAAGKREGILHLKTYVNNDLLQNEKAKTGNLCQRLEACDLKDSADFTKYKGIYEAQCSSSSSQPAETASTVLSGRNEIVKLVETKKVNASIESQQEVNSTD
jgi:hypothetical protein